MSREGTVLGDTSQLAPAFSTVSRFLEEMVKVRVEGRRREVYLTPDAVKNLNRGVVSEEEALSIIFKLSIALNYENRERAEFLMALANLLGLKASFASSEG